ncbi:hypothetical protein DFH09DRAFT_1074879 [Mycena vulgaris]|nr:hypothetical protein DFH09DRAFT_1074879 [Mycena vulgaris]
MPHTAFFPDPHVVWFSPLFGKKLDILPMQPGMHQTLPLCAGARRNPDTWSIKTLELLDGAHGCVLIKDDQSIGGARWRGGTPGKPTELQLSVPLTRNRPQAEAKFLHNKTWNLTGHGKENLTIRVADITLVCTYDSDDNVWGISIMCNLRRNLMIWAIPVDNYKYTELVDSAIATIYLTQIAMGSIHTDPQIEFAGQGQPGGESKYHPISDVLESVDSEEHGGFQYSASNLAGQQSVQGRITPLHMDDPFSGTEYVLSSGVSGSGAFHFPAQFYSMTREIGQIPTKTAHSGVYSACITVSDPELWQLYPGPGVKRASSRRIFADGQQHAALARKSWQSCMTRKKTGERGGMKQSLRIGQTSGITGFPVGGSEVWRGHPNWTCAVPANHLPFHGQGPVPE